MMVTDNLGSDDSSGDTFLRQRPPTANNGTVAIKGCQRVLVEPIIDVVDEEALRNAVDRSFSNKADGASVGVNSAGQNADCDALSTAAKRLLMEILEDEKREAEEVKNNLREQSDKRASTDYNAASSNGQKRAVVKKVQRMHSSPKQLLVHSQRRELVSSSVPSTTDQEDAGQGAENSPVRKIRSPSCRLKRIGMKTDCGNSPFKDDDGRKKTKVADGGKGSAKSPVRKSLVLRLKRNTISGTNQQQAGQLSIQQPVVLLQRAYFADSDNDSPPDEAPSSATETKEEQKKREDMQYPCTVCRKSSSTNEIIRCQSCPRYFHGRCFQGTKRINEHLCPKCARVSEPSTTSSQEESARKKRRHESTVAKEDSGREKKRSKYSMPDSSSAEEWTEIPCPGCRKRLMSALKKRSSIYCSEACVDAVIQRVKGTITDEHERILVADGNTGLMLGKSHSPTVRNFATWLRQHRYYYPVLPGVFGQKTPKSAADEVVKDNAGTPVTSTKDCSNRPTDSKRIPVENESSPEKSAIVDRIRLDVRKAFRDVLVMRAKDAEDILLTNAEIKSVALDLEQNIYKCQTTGKSSSAAYKEQCRKLVSVLRDQSNKGFFRRLLNGELSCKRAAALTLEQMSSKKYSSWMAEEKLSRVSNGHSSTGIAKLGSSLVAAGSQRGSDALTLLQNDATAEHKSHLFHVNCKICTGKTKEDNFPMIDIKRKRDMNKDLPRDGAAVKFRPEGTERLIRREDGVLDVMIPVPFRQKDPLNLNSTSPGGSLSEASPLSVESFYSHSKGISSPVLDHWRN